MTQSDTDLDELKTLQREAAQRRAERRRSESSAESAAPPPSATQPTEASGPSAEDRVEETPAAADQGKTVKPSPQQASDDAAATTQAEAVIQDLADQIGSLVNEMEAAAKEHPAVALLAAFTIGIVIGQLFSRTKG